VADLHWEVVSPFARGVLASLGASAIADRFYLAGGTALALQLGHRISEDLDLFSATDEVDPPTHAKVVTALRRYSPVIVENEWGNLVLLLDGLRTGFFHYGYPVLATPACAEGVPLASLLDVGLMKLDAIAGRASRKDFFDLYAIAQTLPLSRLLDEAPRKYPQHRDFEAYVVRHLAYFDQAERDTEPVLLCEMDWAGVKEFFRQQAQVLARQWLSGQR
jgi:hypothetical protein